MEKSDIEYKVLAHWNPIVLTAIVNDALKEGWQLQGGVACSINEYQLVQYKLFSQAMIRVVKTVNLGVSPAKT